MGGDEAFVETQMNLRMSGQSITAGTVEISGLKIVACLHDLVEREMVPGTGLNSDDIWKSLASIVNDLACCKA